MPATITVPAGSTVVTLTWNIPVTATSNITTYVRLRLTSQITGTTDPVNAYGNGEVEDYVVTTLKSTACTSGTSFFFIQGSAGAGEGIIASVNASTGITTFVNNPPTPSSGLNNINGLAVDPTNRIFYYQDAANNTVPKGIYGYNISTASNFTITTNAQTSLGLPLGSGWQTAAGAFANGKYYAGVDGDDSGRIYEITLNSAGTTAISARNVITPAVQPGCTSSGVAGTGTNCRGYGDVLVDGNRMYVALWANNTTPESQILSVFDINSQVLLSQQIIASNGFAFQLGRDGNGQIYAVTSDTGRIFRVTNGAIVGFPTTGLVSTIGAIINDAGECLASVTIAVKLSSFSAESSEAYGSLSQVALAWTTASEINTAGFNVYRSEQLDGPYDKINVELIPGSTDSLVGGKYQYVDTRVLPGKTYYYQIEDIELDGAATRHHPILVNMPAGDGG